MGMFDYLRCDYPLPCADPAHAASLLYQTKDTPDQLLTKFRITAAGDLEREAGEGATWLGTPGPAGPMPDFTGELIFYTFKHESPPGRISALDAGGWIEFCALVAKGKVVHIELVEDRDGPREPTYD